MRNVLLVILPAVLLLTTACGADRQLRLVSADAIDCESDAIDISDKEGRMVVQAWTAHCGGETYHCVYASNGDADCTPVVVAVAAPNTPAAAPQASPAVTPDGTPATDGQAPATGPVETDDARVRAHLDAHSPALRECVGTSAMVSVEATWDTTGQLSVHVRGQEDSAVDACAQAVVGRQRLGTAGAGRLIHVLDAP